MSGDDDRPGFLDREKKSFSERDRERRERRGSAERRPSGPAQQARVASAKKQYLQQIDSLFAKGKGGAEGERLARVVRDARGTPEAAAACRAYLAAVGAPSDAALLACFLDSAEPDVVLPVLEALSARHAAGELRAASGLRTQLRLLAQHPDDEVASAAEELLDAVG